MIKNMNKYILFLGMMIIACKTYGSSVSKKHNQAEAVVALAALMAYNAVDLQQRSPSQILQEDGFCNLLWRNVTTAGAVALLYESLSGNNENAGWSDVAFGTTVLMWNAYRICNKKRRDVRAEGAAHIHAAAKR